MYYEGLRHRWKNSVLLCLFKKPRIFYVGTGPFEQWHWDIWCMTVCLLGHDWLFWCFIHVLVFLTIWDLNLLEVTNYLSQRNSWDHDVISCTVWCSDSAFSHSIITEALYCNYILSNSWQLVEFQFWKVLHKEKG